MIGSGGRVPPGAWRRAGTLVVSLALTALLATATYAQEDPGPLRVRVPADTSTIGEAIRTVRAGGSIVVAAGTYRESLVIEKPLELRGEGQEICRLELPEKAETGVRIEAIGKVVLHGFAFDGRNLELEPEPPIGVLVESGVVTVERCTVERFRGNGVLVVGATSAATLEANVVRDNGRVGIVIGDGARSILLRNTCERNTRSGLFLAHADVLVVGNTFRNNVLNGIEARQGTKGRLSENTFTGNGVSGIALFHETNSLVVEANACRRNRNFGIYLGDGFTGTVRGNVCTANGSGLGAFGAGTRVRLIRNACEDNADAGMVVGQGARARILDGMVQHNGAAGLLARDEETEVVVTGSVFRANHLSGIVYQTGAVGRAAQNLCTLNDGGGLSVFNKGTAPVLIGNRAHRNGMHGIYFGAGAGGTARRNECVSNPADGIAACDADTRPVLDENRCHGNGNWGINYWKGAAPDIGERNLAEGNGRGQIRGQDETPGTSPPPDGRTLVVPDDHLTVGAALGAARPGDTVRLNPGTYREAVTVPPGVSLVGAGGEASVLEAPDDAECLLRVAGTGAGRIANLTFDGRSIAPLGAPVDGIVLQGASCEVEDCRIRRLTGAGIRVLGAEAAPVLRANVLTDCGEAGCVFEQGAAGTAWANTFLEQERAILVRGKASAPELWRNTCTKCRSHGIQVIEGASPILGGNRCDGSGRCGIAVRGEGTQADLRGNLCVRSGAQGILFAEGASGAAFENGCRESGQAGISVLDCPQGPTLLRNRCEENEGSGLEIGAGTILHADATACLANAGHGVLVWHAESKPLLVNTESQANGGAQLAFLNACGRVRGGRFAIGEVGVSITGAGSEAFLEGIECFGNRAFGIRVSEGAEAELIDCRCRAGGIGVGVLGSAENRTHARVLRGRFTENDEHGLSVGCGDGAAEVAVRESVFQSNRACGMLASGAGTSVRLGDCISSRNRGSGIVVANGARAQVEASVCADNRVAGGAAAGILVRDVGTHAVLRRNVCGRNGTDGLRFERAGEGEAEANECLENDRHGIFVGDRGPDVTLRGNRCRENKKWGLAYGDGATPRVAPDNEGETNRAGDVMPDPTLQRAIHAAGPGETVWVEPGTHRVHLQLGGAVRLSGRDAGTCRLVGMGWQPDVVRVRDAEGAEISHLTIDGEGKATHGVDASNSTLRIEDVLVRGVRDTGVLTRGDESELTIQGLTVEDPGDSGLWIAGGNAEASDVRCSGGRFGVLATGERTVAVLRESVCWECSSAALAFLAASGRVEDCEATRSMNGLIASGGRLTANRCQCTLNIYQGLCAGETVLELDDCEVCSNGDHGIVLRDCPRVRLEGSRIQENDGNGIYVWGGTAEVSVRGNRLERNGQAGVALGGGARAKVEENTCVANHHGITVAGQETAPTLDRNTAHENLGTGIRYELGGGGACSSNRCTENRDHGIFVAPGTSTPEIRGSRCVGNGLWGVAFQDSVPIVADDNVGEGNNWGQVMPDPVLQRAIDAADVGGTVVVPVGVHREFLVLRRPVHLVGEDRTTCRIEAPGMWSEERATVEVRSCPEASLRGLAFAGAPLLVCTILIRDSRAEFANCAFAAPQYAIQAEGAEVQLHDCLCAASLGGILLLAGTTGTVDGSTCVGHEKGVGILLDGAGTDVRLIGNRCDEWVEGIRIGGGARAVAEGNTCQRLREVGRGIGIVVTDPGTRARLERNVCYRTGGGIAIAAGATGVAIGNTCEENGEYGLLGRGPGTMVGLFDNVCRGSGGVGILIRLGAAGTVRGNACEKCRLDGILVLDEGTAPAIEANRCRGNGGWGIDHGEGTSPRVATDNVAEDNAEGQIR